MLARSLLAALGILALTAPALSAQFFIVQDANKRCTVTEQPPANAVIVGDGAYGDQASAEADMKTIFVCSTQAADSGAPAQDTTATTPSR